LNLFGKTLGPQELTSLVFMLVLLAAWLMVLVRERQAHRWFRNWEADRKARRDAEIAAEGGQPVKSEPRGPWG
jgi:hypothetical protein